MPDTPHRSETLAPQDDTIIQDTMRQMAELVGSEWVSAFDYDFQANVAIRTLRWAHPSLNIDPDHVLRVPLQLVPEWDLQAHLLGQPLWIPDTRALPQGLLRQLYTKEGICSVLALPIMEAGLCRGFVQFTWQRPTLASSGQELGLLSLLAKVLVTHTRSQRAEAARREVEQRLTQLSNNLSNGMIYQVIIGVDGRRRFTYLGDTVRRLYGVSPEAAMLDGRLIYDCIHPDDLPGLIQLEDRARKALTTFKAEARVRNPDGSIRWSSYVSTPTLLPDGSTRWDGIEFIITGRKRAEEDRERLLKAVEQAAEAIVITDTCGMIEYVNPAFERITGYSSAEALGQNPRILKSGVQDDEAYRQLWRTIAAGNTWSGCLVNRRKDGALITEEVTISPVKGPDGAVRNYVAVKHDITERLRLEAQYLQSQKLETVGRLAGGVAHDFNNMLGVIFGLTELELMSAEPGQATHQNLLKIQRAAERSAQLTAQLLAFARKQPVSPRSLDLNAAVEGTLDMVRRLIGEHIDLRWAPGAGLGWVHVDPVQVDQVLVNLCVNARDAIGGVGRLELATQALRLDAEFCAQHEGLQPGPYAALTVRDDGAGMDAATLAHIFEPFFSTKGVGKGSGLGLATVYGILKQNGGLIEADSQPGQGATFTVYLPAFSDPPAAAKARPAAQAQASAQVTILLVEDEPALLDLTRQMLEHLGHRVIPALSPSEALRLGREHPGEVHLLVTDVVMPEMNGRELARALQSLYPGLRCLFMSGYTGDIIAKQGILNEGLHFLQKPFRQGDLAAKVSDTLNR